jgi:hypothetical protein
VSKLLLRAGRSPFEVLDAASAIDFYPGGAFAGNIGNMVFSDAVHRILSTPDADIVANTYLAERKGVTQAYIDRVNAEFDKFVVPLANAFRPSFAHTLERLTRTISGLRIPVIVLGVGVGGEVASLSDDRKDAPEELKRIVQRFMNAVLDRSARVGVRGENTRQFLRSLGYHDEHVQVIGCPSLFRYGPDLRIDKDGNPLTIDDKIAINLTPSVEQMAECSRRHAGLYPQSIYIPQELAALRVLFRGIDPKHPDAKIAMHMGQVFHAQNRVISFIDSRSWIDFMRTVRFSFGTRIHGNIAALIAGTPAVVVVHDARTQELVDYHQIPSRPASKAAGLDAAELYDAADFSDFNAGHVQRLKIFHDFLRENELETIFDHGKANRDYDRRLAALPLAPPLRPGSGRHIGRVHQVRRMVRRRTYRFSAPVPHAPASLLDAATRLIARKLPHGQSS